MKIFKSLFLILTISLIFVGIASAETNVIEGKYQFSPNSLRFVPTYGESFELDDLVPFSAEIRGVDVTVQSLKDRVQITQNSLDIDTRAKVVINVDDNPYRLWIVDEVSDSSVEIKKFLSETVNSVLSVETNVEVSEADIIIRDKNPVYDVTLKRPTKIFGFIPIGQKIKTKINAHNGQVLEVGKSWWSFLIFGKEKQEGVAVIEALG